MLKFLSDSWQHILIFLKNTLLLMFESTKTGFLLLKLISFCLVGCKNSIRLSADAIRLWADTIRISIGSLIVSAGRELFCCCQKEQSSGLFICCWILCDSHAWKVRESFTKRLLLHWLFEPMKSFLMFLH